MAPDWLEWHSSYADPESSLSRRLVVVQRRIAEAFDRAAPGRIQVVSMCAGQGKDLVGVVPGHPRRDDVHARLVELDPRNVELARAAASAAGLAQIEIVEGDASITTAYAGAVPADVVLVCGVFGNVTDDDIRTTIGLLPTLCAPGATVLWTRHRRAPDATPAVRRWFTGSGFEELHFDTADDVAFGIGTARLVADPQPFRPDARMFTFVGDGADAMH